VKLNLDWRDHVANAVYRSDEAIDVRFIAQFEAQIADVRAH
jgi:hypothetical protein